MLNPVKIPNWIYGLLFITVLAGCASDEVTAAAYEEGKHYLKVPSPKPDSNKSVVSVVEFFSYGCPHCFRVEPVLAQWKETKPSYIEFKRMPAYWNPKFELYAQAFYTAELMKVLDKVHMPIFNALHQQRRPLSSAQSFKVLFQEQGVDVADFDKVFNSFAVRQKLKLADNSFMNFKLSSVPSIVVGGTYSTDVSAAGGSGELVKVINYLANKVKNEK